MPKQPTLLVGGGCICALPEDRGAPASQAEGENFTHSAVLAPRTHQAACSTPINSGAIQ